MIFPKIKFMRGQRSSQPSGCGEKIVRIIFIVFFGLGFIGSFFAASFAERIALETVCRPGTIHNDSWGRRRETTCINKDTGKKTDVSLMQIFQCCPLAIVLGFIFIFTILMFLIRPKSTNQHNSMPHNFRYFNQ
jgi:hypothetical protein